MLKEQGIQILQLRCRLLQKYGGVYNIYILNLIT
jgi:hypothetical protein